MTDVPWPIHKSEKFRIESRDDSPYWLLTWMIFPKTLMIYQWRLFHECSQTGYNSRIIVMVVVVYSVTEDLVFVTRNHRPNTWTPLKSWTPLGLCTDVDRLIDRHTSKVKTLLVSWKRYNRTKGVTPSFTLYPSEVEVQVKNCNWVIFSFLEDLVVHHGSFQWLRGRNPR